MTMKQGVPWPQLSFALARQVVKLDIHKSFLSPTETEAFTGALTSFSAWKEFIDSTSSNNLITFRVRAMLSEQFILSPHSRPCCRYNVDLDQLYQQAQRLNTSEEEPENSPEPSNGQEEEEEQTISNSDHVPLLDIYHTLEFDMAAMIEQRKLEEHQAQDDAAAAAAATTTTTTTTTSNALSLLDDHRAADEFNWKYLSKGITENRDKIQLSDRELRNLLLELRPHRSKWANEDKVGQEDLYEACEKVLTDLKNYTEHSTPFLSKVSKREAPDYFDVIKHPMDLGTVGKKLKQFQYKTKKEFSEDLYLIYENCLVYNTNPSSEYRKHAIAMRRKTDRLLTRVPDIVVKENVDHDLDESDAEEDKSTATRERSITHDSLMAETTEINDNHHVHTGGKHPQKGTTLTEIDKENEEQAMAQELDQDKGELQTQLWREITKQTRAKLTTDVEKQYQFDFADRAALKRSPMDMERFHMLEHLHHDPHSTKKLIRCKKSALTRWMTRQRLTATSIYDTFDLTSEDEDETDDGGGFFFLMNKHKSEPTDEEDAVRTDLFLPEYNLMVGLPEIEGVPEEYLKEGEEEEQEGEGPTFDMYPITKLTSSALTDTMDRNIATISSIRSTYKKCKSIQDNMPLSMPAAAQDHPSPIEMMDTDSPIPTSSQLPPINITQEASQQLIQRSLFKILAHAGFESADSKALNILTDIMIESLSNLGKTARKYLDEHSKTMSAEDILHHTLKENGVDNLEAYVTQDVKEYGVKLQDLNEKLESSYCDLIHGSIKDSKAWSEDVLFDEENDLFVTGLFDKELVEEQDFFGFKALGLDQEFHMQSLSLPPKLLYHQEKIRSITALSNHSEPQTKYPYPPPFQPVTKKSFIGLLRPWFTSGPAVQDTQPLGKPKYPPIHLKSAYSKTKRPRILKDGSNTQQEQPKQPQQQQQSTRKRAKKVEDVAAKLQKKKLKSEQRALKLAEKEQKKRLREEEKKMNKRNK